MDTVQVPKTGLVLTSPSKLDNDAQVKPPQIMELDLAGGVLDELVRSVRQGKKDVHLCFGKIPVCSPSSHSRASD